jgi:hypothetical protein
MSNIVVFQWIENPRSARLAAAQARLEESISSYGLTPLRYPAGRDLIPIGDVLAEARRQTKGSAFVWCNSDVVLTKNPFVVPNPQQVYGFYRKEVPSGEICGGVDMYYIPVWDLGAEILHPYADIWNEATAVAGLAFPKFRKYFQAYSWKRAWRIRRQYTFCKQIFR